MINECGSIDVVHYNSEDSYEEMKWAYETLFPQLRKGGVFISNDISGHSAFKDFCESRNLTPNIVKFEDKLIGVFIK